MPRIAGDPTVARPPQGPYSASARVGSIIGIAGQCGFVADGTLADGLEAQIRAGMNNLVLALRASGVTPDDVVSVQVYLTDAEHFGTMNKIYAEYFDQPYPARTTVYVGLRGGALFEVNAIAAATPEPGA
ncbi:MAG TPA: RidA family protein [Trebonia sp.]|jgi:2-iminobutanoate/2-iminopropanoate deaminase|nr:RidA family protein [Trebonia sp.]